MARKPPRLLGADIPGEVSITGFDDMEIAAQLAPGLTTMRLPTVDLGRSAAAYLLDRLAGREVAPRSELPVELVVRGSTAPPRGRAPHRNSRGRPPGMAS